MLVTPRFIIFTKQYSIFEVFLYLSPSLYIYPQKHILITPHGCIKSMIIFKFFKLFSPNVILSYNKNQWEKNRSYALKSFDNLRVVILSGILLSFYEKYVFLYVYAQTNANIIFLCNRNMLHCLRISKLPEEYEKHVGPRISGFKAFKILLNRSHAWTKNGVWRREA